MGAELVSAALKEPTRVAAEMAAAMEARMVANQERVDAERRQDRGEMYNMLGSFSTRLRSAEGALSKPAEAPPAYSENAASGIGTEAESPKLDSTMEARGVASKVMSDLRGPVVSDGASLSPMKHLDRAVAGAAAADREVSPSKEDVRATSRRMEEGAAELSATMRDLVERKGERLVRQLGYDRAAEQLGKEAGQPNADMDELVQMLIITFPSGISAPVAAASQATHGDEEIEDQNDKAVSEKAGSVVLDQSDELEHVMYVRSDGRREEAVLVRAERDGSLVVRLAPGTRNANFANAHLVRIYTHPDIS
jgi:hypothetical protein